MVLETTILPLNYSRVYRVQYVKDQNFLTVTSKYELDMIISPPLKLSQDRFENLYPDRDSNPDPIKEGF